LSERILLFRRPEEAVITDLLSIIDLLTPSWFSENVVEDTRKDLYFQDAICLTVDGRIVSFIIFTSWEGNLYITLMATHPEYQHQGYGSVLLLSFFEHAGNIGFKEIKLLTVPPEVKPNYESTISFYQRHGFYTSKSFREIWGSGALELTRVVM
jgi:ribosomal protein S18 acetylase RimI-like enzyme